MALEALNDRGSIYKRSDVDAIFSLLRADVATWTPTNMLLFHFVYDDVPGGDMPYKTEWHEDTAGHNVNGTIKMWFDGTQWHFSGFYFIDNDRFDVPSVSGRLATDVIKTLGFATIAFPIPKSMVDSALKAIGF
jgi:hypothetical protein